MNENDELARLRSTCNTSPALGLLVTALLIGTVLASTTLHLSGLDAVATVLLR